MQLPHDGSLLGRIQYEIEVLESRIPHAATIPEVLHDIRRTITVLYDSCNYIKCAEIDIALEEMGAQP